MLVTWLELYKVDWWLLIDVCLSIRDKLHHGSNDQESVCIALCELGIKRVCMYVCMYM